MGFDLNSTRFILQAKRDGADFSRTLTLGRQGLHLGTRRLYGLLGEVGLKLNAEQRTVIERGFPYADGLLRVLGAETLETMDASSYEGASIVHDMNNPIPASLTSAFTLVVDFGTLEHIFNFPVAAKNIINALRTGGSFLTATTANNFMGHGFYQFSPELFFRVFSIENGFEVQQMYLCEDRLTNDWYEVPDPAIIRGRVELRNSLPTLMLMRARKIAEIEPFLKTPQQSDYETQLWSKGAENHDGIDESAGLMEFGRRWIPAWMKNLRRAVRRIIRSPFAAPYFRRVNKRTITASESLQTKR
jgi:hypothetical protein